MSEISIPPLIDETAGIRARLARLRSRLRAWGWVEGLGRVLWLAIIVFAVDLLLDRLLRMDRAQRAVMLVLMGATIGWAIQRWLVRILSRPVSDDALALQVEGANLRLGQSLITALQLSRTAGASAAGASPTLIRHAVVSGAKLAQELSFDNLIDRRRFARNCLVLFAAVTIFTGVALGTLPAGLLQTWFLRNILLTSAAWPQATYLVLEHVTRDGTVIVPRGEDWTQRVTISPASRVVPGAVYLDFRRADGRAPLVMHRRSERQFEAAFSRVAEPFEFRARGGDDVTPWVRLELVEPPALTELKLIVTPPPYAGSEPETLPPGGGPYYVLRGSSLEISAIANKPLARANITVNEESHALALSDPRRLGGHIGPTALLPGRYSVELQDTLGLVGSRPTMFQLLPRVDRAPHVRVTLRSASGMVTSQGRVPFRCWVTDDFGLTAVGARHSWTRDDVSPQGEGEGLLAFEQLNAQLSAASVGRPSDLLEIDFEDALDLAALKVPAGAGLSFHFEAGDNDDVSGPNVGRSSDFFLRVVTPEELRSDLLRREKEQRQELVRLLKEQESLITDCQALSASIKDQSERTDEQSEQLLQFHTHERLVGQGIAALGERIAAMVVEIQDNRLEKEGGAFQSRLSQGVAEPLRTVADELIPAAIAALQRSRHDKDLRLALMAAVTNQTQIAARMREILDHMIQAEGFQEAVNLLYEIQKAQAEVNAQTNKARHERIKRILEGAVP